MFRYILKMNLVLLFSVFISGCATVTTLKDINRSYALRNPNNCLVFGKVILNNMGDDGDIYCLMFESLETKKRYIYSGGKMFRNFLSGMNIVDYRGTWSEYFLLELPVGNYKLFRVNISNESYFFPNIILSVSDDGSLNYIGSLNITPQEKRNLLSPVNYYDVEVVNQYEEAALYFNKVHAYIKKELVINLMIPDPNPQRIKRGFSGYGFVVY